MKVVNLTCIMLASFFLLITTTMVESRIPSSTALHRSQQEKQETQHLKHIKEICNKTVHYDLCVGILFPDGRTYGSNLKGYAKIIFEYDLSISMDLLSSAQLLAYDSRIDPKLRAKCEKCAKRFKKIIYELFPKANQAIAFGKFDDAFKALTLVGKNSMACSDDGDSTCPLVSPSVHDMSHIVIGILKEI